MLRKAYLFFIIILFSLEGQSQFNLQLGLSTVLESGSYSECEVDLWDMSLPVWATAYILDSDGNELDAVSLEWEWTADVYGFVFLGSSDVDFELVDLDNSYFSYLNCAGEVVTQSVQSEISFWANSDYCNVGCSDEEAENYNSDVNYNCQNSCEYTVSCPEGQELFSFIQDDVTQNIIELQIENSEGEILYPNDFPITVLWAYYGSSPYIIEESYACLNTSECHVLTLHAETVNGIGINSWEIPGLDNSITNFWYQNYEGPEDWDTPVTLSFSYPTTNSDCHICSDEYACNYGEITENGNDDCSYPFCGDTLACNYNIEENCGIDTCYYNCIGCTDPTACNYFSDHTVDLYDECTYPGCTLTSFCSYDPNAGCMDFDFCHNNYCNDPSACNFNPLAGCANQNCIYDCCDDPEACNFYPDLEVIDNELCTYPGCTWSNAINYDPTAGCDDGSCIFTDCTDPFACNYFPSATIDDGSCTYPGCTDPMACNFDPEAGCDNGSCGEWGLYG